MAYESTPYTLPLAIATIIGLALFAVTTSQRSQKGALPLLGIFGSMSVWAGSYALQLSSTTLGEALFWNTVRFFGPAFITVAFIVLALQYTGREDYLTQRNVALLLALPVVTVLLVWTDYAGVHDLVRTSAEMVTEGGTTRLALEFGPWYYIHALYSFGLAFAAIGLLAAHVRNVTGTVRNRTAVICVGGIFPALGTLLFAADVTAIDWGPVTYIITGITWTFVIFYY